MTKQPYVTAALIGASATAIILAGSYLGCIAPKQMARDASYRGQVSELQRRDMTTKANLDSANSVIDRTIKSLGSAQEENSQLAEMFDNYIKDADLRERSLRRACEIYRLGQREHFDVDSAIIGGALLGQ